MYINARIRPAITFLGAFFAVLCTNSHVTCAAAVYGNGNLSDTAHFGGLGFGSHDAYALPFSVGASTSAGQRTLTGAYILFSNLSASAVTTTIGIYDTASVNSGPNTIQASGSLSIGSTGTSSIWQYVPFSSPIVLSQNGNYYFTVASSVSTASVAWQIPNTDRSYSDLNSGSGYQLTPLAPTLYTLPTAQSTWTDASGSPGATVANSPLGFQLVPEPSTYAMLLAGVGCGAAGIVRRRRRGVSTR